MRTNFKGFFFFFFGFSLQENVRRVSREGRESIEVLLFLLIATLFLLITERDLIVSLFRIFPADFYAKK